MQDCRPVAASCGTDASRERNDRRRVVRPITARPARPAVAKLVVPAGRANEHYLRAQSDRARPVHVPDRLGIESWSADAALPGRGGGVAGGDFLAPPTGAG